MLRLFSAIVTALGLFASVCQGSTFAKSKHVTTVTARGSAETGTCVVRGGNASN